MPPAFANRIPRRAFGERRGNGEFRLVGGFSPLFDRFRHGHNVPSLTPRANTLSLPRQYVAAISPSLNREPREIRRNLPLNKLGNCGSNG
jgi:hypothetical protein